MSLKLQQLAVWGTAPRDAQESCLTEPGCTGTRNTSEPRKKEKGNQIKAKSSLNTKGDLGKSGTCNCERPGVGQSCSGLSTPEETVPKAGCREGQGLLAGAEGWYFSSWLSTAALDRCISLGGVDN